MNLPIKYRPTPLNITCAVMAVYDIYLFVFAPAPGLVMAGVYMIPVILAGMAVDLLMQLIFKERKWLFIIEIIFILVVVVINQVP